MIVRGLPLLLGLMLLVAPAMAQNTDPAPEEPAEKIVAVSMSIAIERVLRRYSLNATSCSQTRRLVVYTVPVQ